MVIDKTGTLTQGVLHLQEVRLFHRSDSTNVDRLAGSLGAASSHPVSRALAGIVHLTEHIALENIRDRPALGVIADSPQGQAVPGLP